MLDGEEIVELKYEYNKDKTKVRVTGKLKSNPASIDSDGDGLYDYSERVVNGRTVAPIDPEPLKKNGLDGVWDNHVYQQEYGVVATQYADGEGMQLEDITNSIRKYIYADIPNDEGLADAIVELIVKLEGPLKEVDGIASFGASIVRKFCNFAFQTEGGAYILNFVYDDKMVVYHSKPDTWQRYFGYNRFYDLVFEVGSNMHYLPFEFSTRDEEYVLWMWKGDYWNLQSGAEIGLYMNPQTYGDMIHYDTIDFEVPMTLSLYNYYNKEKIDNIFNWAPEVEQWWITGFSGQNKDFMNPDPEKMVVVGTVDLSENTYMYNALKNANDNYDDEKQEKFDRYLMFNDEEKTVWVIWYEGVQ